MPVKWFGFFFVLCFPLVVSAAPSANFTARPIQGSTCVAPCAVHFDAIGNGTTETTDPDFTREFHSLLYLWSFGDPGSGTWTTSGLSKNHGVGAIQGALFPVAYPSKASAVAAASLFSEELTCRSATSKVHIRWIPNGR